MTHNERCQLAALFSVMELSDSVGYLPPEVRATTEAAVAAARVSFEKLMRATKGFYTGDSVMHGSRGPFRVVGFARKDGLLNPVIQLAPLKKDGTLSAKVQWDYLDATLTLV